MNRIILAAAGTAAACAVAVPAIAGLSGNPSFSQRIPVPVPSHARLVQFDDNGLAIQNRSPATRTPSPSRDDDHGGARTTRAPEPGDDNGGHSGGVFTSTASATTASSAPGDDPGRHGGGSDDTGSGRSGRSGHTGHGGDDN